MASQPIVATGDPTIDVLAAERRPQALRLQSAAARAQKTRAVFARDLDALDRELVACVRAGLSFSEIGRIIGISKQAAHVRFSKAKASL